MRNISATPEDVLKAFLVQSVVKSIGCELTIQWANNVHQSACSNMQARAHQVKVRGFLSCACNTTARVSLQEMSI